jgi:ligand-binding sensor domain-containing protein
LHRVRRAERTGAKGEAFLFQSLKHAFGKKKRLLLLGAALAAAGVAAGVFRQASEALRESSEAVAAESQLAFRVVRLGASSSAAAGTAAIGNADSAPAAAPFAVGAAPFEWISTPLLFGDAAAADGALYVAGPAGIFEYDSQGSLRKHYRVGLDLPAPPAAVAIGLSTAQAGRALYVATAGEGLLIRDGLQRGSSAAGSSAAGDSASRAPFLQIRAEDAAYRDLTAVLPLNTGRVLLGSRRNGVLLYDGKRLAALHPSLSELAVTALAGDESSTWIGTLDQGLLLWHAGRLQRFGENEGLPDRQVLSLALEGNRVFAGTPLGVAEFRDGRFERELAPGFFANSLLIRNKSLLVGTLDEGVVEVPLEAARPRGPRLESKGLGEIEDAAVQRLIEIGGAPYALAADGLYRLDAKAGETRQVLERSNAVLTDRNISALNMDAAGRLWVGYFDRGLDILEPSLGRARHIEDEHVFCVNRIVEAKDKGLTAVATANGLVMFDAAGQIRHVLGRDEGLIANHVTDVWFGATGMIAATPAGITFVDAAGSRSLYAFHGLVNNHVYTLAAAGERLLAGTLGGLSVLDAGVVRASYTTGNSELKHNWITSIVAFDHDWFVGTYGAGILRLDETGRWHAFPEAGRPLEINPNAMAAGADRVYAGALGEGLYVYERASGRWRVVTAGLPSRNVTALELAGGYLYVGTDNGLVRVAESGI